MTTSNIEYPVWVSVGPDEPLHAVFITNKVTLWLDTSDPKHAVLKYWNGTSWVV